MAITPQDFKALLDELKTMNSLLESIYIQFLIFNKKERENEKS